MLAILPNSNDNILLSKLMAEYNVDDITDGNIAG